MKLTKGSNNAIVALLLTVVVVLIYLLTRHQVWLMDEQSYQLNFATNEPIRSFYDIFQSQCEHYLVRNGRFVAHYLVQIMVSFCGPFWFAVINALVYIPFIWIVLRLVDCRMNNLGQLATAIILVLIYSDFEYVPSVHVGYVWMAVLILGFMLLLKHYNEKRTLKAWILPLLFIYSVIAGNSQETFVIGILASLGIFILISRFRLNVYQWVLIIGFVIGGLWLALSPANFQKAGDLDIPLLYSMLKAVFAFRLFYIFLVILIYKLVRKEVRLKTFYTDNYIYINAMVVFFAMNFYIGIYGGRQLFGIELFSIILIMKLLKRKSMTPFWIAAFGIALVWLTVMKFKQISKTINVYETLLSEMSDDANQRIFIDLPYYHTYMNPVITFKFGAMDGPVGGVYRDIHGLNVENFDLPQVYPDEFKNRLEQPIKNQVIEYLPGEFMAIQDKSNPATFVLKRSIGIGKIKMPLPDFIIKFDPDNYLNTEDYNTIYIANLFPVIHNDEIVIKENERDNTGTE